MLEIKGKVNTAICYAKVIDEGGNRPDSKNV